MAITINELKNNWIYLQMALHSASSSSFIDAINFSCHTPQTHFKTLHIVLSDQKSSEIETKCSKQLEDFSRSLPEYTNV